MKLLLVLCVTALTVVGCAATKIVDDYQGCIENIQYSDADELVIERMACHLALIQANAEAQLAAYNLASIETRQEGKKAFQELEISGAIGDLELSRFFDLESRRRRNCEAFAFEFLFGASLRDTVRISNQTPLIDHTFDQQDCEANGYDLQVR